MGELKTTSCGFVWIGHSVIVSDLERRVAGKHAVPTRNQLRDGVSALT